MNFLPQFVLLLLFMITQPIWGTKHIVYDIHVHEFDGSGKDAPLLIKLRPNCTCCNSVSWIEIDGLVHRNADKFTIDLTNPYGDIVFHFKPRFTWNKVVRNSLPKGKEWGPQETDGGFPFQRSRRFNLTIVFDEDYYRTYVNKIEFVTYKHRLSAKTVDELEIYNDVTLFRIAYRN